MRKLITILLLLISSATFAQVGDIPPLPTDPNFKTLSTYSLKYYITSKHVWVFRGNNTWTELLSPRDLKFQIDSLAGAGYTKVEVDNKLLLKINTSEKGQQGGVATLDQNGKVPTTQLNVDLSSLLNKGDTASMLSNYTQKALVNLKLNKTDTTAMLGNYKTSINSRLKVADTASMLSNYPQKALVNTKLNKSDTLGMLSPYATKILVGTKLNKADTAAMLAGYNSALNNRLKLTDTTGMLSGYKNSLNNRLKLADTLSMLSHYAKQIDVALRVNISDTAQMLSTYLKLADIAGKKDKTDSTAGTGYTSRDRLTTQLRLKPNWTDTTFLNKRDIVINSKQPAGSYKLKNDSIAKTGYFTNYDADSKEPIIISGLSTQYWNGLKQWVTFPIATPSEVYKGTWNASTNTPTLANGTGTSGWRYRVIATGTVLGATFTNGDDAIYDGSVWQDVPAATVIGNALTKQDGVNVTLTLDANAPTALLQPTKLTLGWTGVLSAVKGGSESVLNTGALNWGLGGTLGGLAYLSSFPVASVNTKTGVVVLTPDDLDDASTSHKFVSATDISNWNGKTSNTGTVTNIATGYGITGGAITTTGTLVADSSVLLSKIRAGHDYMPKGYIPDGSDIVHKSGSETITGLKTFSQNISQTSIPTYGLVNTTTQTAGSNSHPTVGFSNIVTYTGLGIENIVKGIFSDVVLNTPDSVTTAIANNNHIINNGSKLNGGWGVTGSFINNSGSFFKSGGIQANSYNYSTSPLNHNQYGLDVNWSNTGFVDGGTGIQLDAWLSGTTNTFTGLQLSLYAAGGTTRELVGVDLGYTHSWTGTPQNSYGIYIDSTTNIGTVKNYAIYSTSLAPSFFKGILAASFIIKNGGTGSQILMANGSVIDTTLLNKRDVVINNREILSNKQSDLTTSATKYPTVNAVIAGLTTKEAPLTFSTGLSRVGNTITNTITQYTDALARSAQYTSSSTVTGLLTSTNWNTFNNKQPAGIYSTDIHSNITALNAVSGSNTGDQTIPTTLPASDVSAWAKAISKPSYSFNEINEAVTVGVAPSTLTRRVIYSDVIDAQGYTSRIALGLSRSNYSYGTGVLSIGNNDAGTSYTDFLFHLDGNISSPRGTFAVETDIPTNTNQLTNGNGYITGYTETDPTISTWAKSSTKPSYSWSEINSHPTVLSQFTNDLGNYGGFVTGTPWTGQYLPLSGGTLTGQLNITPVVGDVGYHQTANGDFNIDAPSIVGGRFQVLESGIVKIGSTTPSASSTTGALIVGGGVGANGASLASLAGSGVRMVVADANGTVSTQSIPTSGAGGTITSIGGSIPITITGTTAVTIGINAATTSASGSMSAGDKIKLDGITSGAQVNVAETDPVVRAINGIIHSTGSSLTAAVAGDFPTLNQSTTGNALTATTATSANTVTNSVTVYPATYPVAFLENGSTNQPVYTNPNFIFNPGTGLLSATQFNDNGGNSTQWNTAFADRNKWDGGSAGLTTATGRTSLGLGNSAIANVGTTSGTVAAGDDSRFTDARTPVAHNQSWNTITTDRPTTLAGYGITDGASTATSGTYVPTITNLNGTSTIVVKQCTYLKIGDIVHVKVTGTFVQTQNNPSLSITLPFNNPTGQLNEPMGSGFVENPDISTVMVRGESTSSVWMFYLNSNISSNCSFAIQFDYSVN